mgnify:FL=1
MKKLIFLLSFYLLVSPLFGQTSKPSVFVIPPKIKGGLSDIQIKFLLITLDDSLSNYFDISLPPQNKSGECLIGCNFFQLEVEKHDGDSQISLRMTNDEYNKKETKLCANCNTTELNEMLKNMVENFVIGKKLEKNIEQEKKLKGFLFLRLLNGEFRWFKEGSEDKDGKYEGIIFNGLPSNEGTLTWPDGEKYIGEWKDGRKNASSQGIFDHGGFIYRFCYF